MKTCYFCNGTGETPLGICSCPAGDKWRMGQGLTANEILLRALMGQKQQQDREELLNTARKAMGLYDYLSSIPKPPSHSTSKWAEYINPRTKKTVIPDGGMRVRPGCIDYEQRGYEPHESEVCDREIEDSITTTTIDDILGAV